MKTHLLLFTLLLGAAASFAQSQNSSQEPYKLLATRENVDFYYRWTKTNSCASCAGYINLKIHNRNGVRKDIHQNFQWLVNGQVVKNDKSLITMRPGETRAGDISGQYYYPPDGYKRSQLQFRFEYLYVCDYNVDCSRPQPATGQQRNQSGNGQNSSQPPSQTGRSSATQPGNQSQYPNADPNAGQQQRAAEAERQRQAAVAQQQAELQRRQQQLALEREQIQQQATQSYNQQMAQLEQNQQLVQQGGDMVAKILEFEVDSLAKSDAMALLSGGIGGLLSPFITSNQTNSGEKPLSWSAGASSLNRNGVSFIVLMGRALQYSNRFAIRAQGQSGASSLYSGSLSAELITFNAAIGKDFLYSANGRFHLFLGAGVGYMMLSHSWEYLQGRTPYVEPKLDDTQWYVSVNSQAVFMFSERFGIQGSMQHGTMLTSTNSEALYKPGSLWSGSLGICLRVL